MKEWPRVVIFSKLGSWLSREDKDNLLPTWVLRTARKPHVVIDLSYTLLPKMSGTEWTVRPRSSETSLGSTKSLSSLGTEAGLTWLGLTGCK